MNPSLHVSIEIVLDDGTRECVLNEAHPIPARSLPIVKQTAQHAWDYMLEVLRERVPAPPVHHRED